MSTASKSELGSVRHVISLIQNHQLDSVAEQFLRACEVTDLVANHIDTTII